MMSLVSVPTSKPVFVPESTTVPMSVVAPLMTERAFCDWLASVEPGACVEYYRGFLAFDRTPSAQVLSERRRQELVAVARRALQAAEDKRVLLVQRRHGDGDYSYFAILASRPIRRHDVARGLLGGSKRTRRASRRVSGAAA